MPVTRASEFQYEVECAFCGEEYEVSVCPEFCALCGEPLDEPEQAA